MAEEKEMQEKSTQPMPEKPEQKGGSKTWLWIILIVVGVLIIALIAYLLTASANKASELAAEQTLSNLAGEDVDISSTGDETTISTGEGSAQTSKSWPSDMPSVVPEFSYGTLDQSATVSAEGMKTWTVTYTAVQSGSSKTYEQELASAGWTNVSDFTDGEVISFSVQNGEYTLVFEEDSATATASLSVAQDAATATE